MEKAGVRDTLICLGRWFSLERISWCTHNVGDEDCRDNRWCTRSTYQTRAFESYLGHTLVVLVSPNAYLKNRFSFRPTRTRMIPSGAVWSRLVQALEEEIEGLKAELEESEAANDEINLELQELQEQLLEE